MANAVIATSHASLASGVYSAVKMIAGKFENLKIQEFKENYKSLKDYENVIVLADLAGGTPFNRAVMTLGDLPNVRVIAGLNFASLYQALNSSGNLDESVEEIINIGKESVIQYKNENEIEDDNFEDGI